MTNDIIGRFLYKDFGLINSNLSYPTIKAVDNKLSVNGTTIYSTLSDGRLSLLGLVIPPTIYNTITNVASVRLLNLGS